jgi:serine/threonine protein phosphatase PrpC
MQYHFAAFTHAGSYYKENQDAILVEGRVYQAPNAFLTGTLDTDQLTGSSYHRLAVADGVSGQPAAAAASRTLLDVLQRFDLRGLRLPPSETAEELRDGLSAVARRQPRIKNGCTTLVTVELSSAAIRLWHCGDSRGYKFSRKNGQLVQLTQDHTALDALQKAGEIPVCELGKYKGGMLDSVENLFVLSAYSDAPKPTTCLPSLAEDECLILCSDGLFENLSNADLQAVITAVLQQPENLLPNIVQALLDATLAFPMSDNISVIAIEPVV